MLQGAENPGLQRPVRGECLQPGSLLTWCVLWEISNMGKIMDPSRLRCAWSRAGPNCLVGNARRCPAGETDLDGLMAKQVVDAHENATRQTVCP